MKYLMKSFGIFAIIFAMTFQAKAQYGAMAASSCPYQMNMGEEVTSKQDDLKQAQQDLKDIQADLKDAKSDVRDAQNALKLAEKQFELRGLKSEYAEVIEKHIENNMQCKEYNGFPLVGGRNNPEVQQQAQPSQRHNSSNSGSYLGKNPYADSVTTKPINNSYDAFAKGSQTSEEKAATAKGTNGSNEEISQDRMPASEVVSERNTSTTANPTNDSDQHFDPFTADEAAIWCFQGAKGAVSTSVCNIPAAKVDHGWNYKSCTDSLKALVDSQKRLEKSQAEQDRLEADVEAKKYEINVMKQDVKTAIRERQREIREEMSEGGCTDCFLQSNGYAVQGRGAVEGSSNTTGAVLTNLGLGLASMYFGNQMQKDVATNNARLGFPTQPIPSFGYGYPFIMAGVAAAVGGGAGGGYYGAVGSGGGNGAFGCANTGSNGGMYGQNGVMGYPNGMYGQPMAGGMYNPGMGSWGMNGPMGGINGMFPGGLMGGLNGMQMGGYGGGMMMSGGIMMGGGYPMGGMMMGGGYPMGGMGGIMASGGIMMGGGYPMGGMMMGGYPMGGMMGMPMGGAMMSGGIMMGGGYPMGGMMGMPMGGGYPMGGMMGMPMGGGIMASGGIMMGGGYPMGGMMGMPMGSMMAGGIMSGGMMGMPMGGMMGMDPSMMQMQMQMQQQQMQMQMQMQQRAQENYMARYQSVMGLQSEMQGLMMRLQQAEMSLQYGGYTDISLGVGAGTSYYGTGSLTQPIYSTPYSTPYGTSTPIYNGGSTIYNGGATTTGSASVR